MSEPWLSPTTGGVFVDLYIAPRASRTRIIGTHDGRLKVQVAAPPVDGTANKELLRFVAKELGVRKADVCLVSGQTGRRKRLLVEGLELGEVERRLRPG